jgi:hypothetical protein
MVAMAVSLSKGRGRKGNKKEEKRKKRRDGKKGRETKCDVSL